MTAKRPLLYRIILTLVLALTVTQSRAEAPSEPLRQLLEALAAGSSADIAGIPLHRPGLVARFYQDRDHRPAWTGDGALAGKAADLLQSIRSAAAHGLQPARYHEDALAGMLGMPRAGQAHVLELFATDAFLVQAIHRSTGVVSPRDLDPDWELLAPEADPLAVLQAALQSGDVQGVLASLWPEDEEYHALVRERTRILEAGETHSEPVAAGPLIRPGQQGERVAQLRRRLLGPLAAGDQYDAPLEAAVRAFQLSAGLEPDGLVGEATLELLNTGRVAWLERLDANLERWRWLPRRPPTTRIRVNIASYTLRVIREGNDAMRMKIIAGRPARRSPVFTEKLRYMVFNPYWNVPFKLATQDKLPELRKDPREMIRMGYEFSHGAGKPFLPLDAQDWSAINRGNFHFLLRQRPGPKNALGRVKFMMPNPHAVYLHDTPYRELFAKEERAFSSGCIRLSEPLQLAQWLLENDGQSDTALRIPQILEKTDPVTVHLRNPVPTQIVYFTAFTDGEGRVVYRRDVYQRDAALAAALRS